MSRYLLAILILGGCFAVGSSAWADEDDEDKGPTLYDKTYDIKVAEFENQVIETDHFVVNNIVLARVRNDYGDEKVLERVSFGASLKGRSAKNQEVTVMLAGYDEKKTLLWTMTANDSLYGRTVGAMNGQVRVPQGSFKSTTDIWMRIIVLTSGR